MQICKHCGKSLIPYGGKCVHCGAPVDARKIRGIYDLVFCIDCTNSKALAGYVRQPIINLLTALEIAGCDWRARAIGYGDFEFDEEPIQNDNVFVNSVGSFQSQFHSLPTLLSGWRRPESTLDAIWYAAKGSEWRKRCKRFVFVFTDAQTKEVNEKTTDEILGTDTDIDILIQELDVLHIRLNLWGPRDPVYEKLQLTPLSEITLFNDAEYSLFSKVDVLQPIYDYQSYLLDSECDEDDY